MIEKLTKKVKIGQQEVMGMIQTEQTKLNLLNNRRQSVVALSQEQKTTINCLKALKEAKQGEKILVPLGSGVFMETEIKNNKKVQSSAASDLLVKADIVDVIKKLEKSKNSISKDNERISKQQTNIIKNLQNLQKLLNQLTAKKK